MIIWERRKKKPENSRTVNQWGLRGRIPVDSLKTQYVWYVWEDWNGEPTSVYYLEDNTREMTEEEKADFQADRKAFRERYVQMIRAERERRRKEAQEVRS